MADWQGFSNAHHYGGSHHSLKTEGPCAAEVADYLSCMAQLASRLCLGVIWVQKFSKVLTRKSGDVPEVRKGSGWGRSGAGPGPRWRLVQTCQEMSHHPCLTMSPEFLKVRKSSNSMPTA